MKWRYAWKDIRNNFWISLLIFIQLTITLLIFISVVSVMTVRYDRYSEIRPFLRSQGNSAWYTYFLENKSSLMQYNDSSKVEEQMQKTNVIAEYRVNLCTNAKTMAYDTEIIECHTPMMAAGRWLRKSDDNTEAVEIVVAQKDAERGRYQVGDYLKLSEDGNDEVVPVDKEQAESEDGLLLYVAGIIEEGASVYGTTDLNWNYSDYRFFFWNYQYAFEEQTYFWMGKNDILQAEMKHPEAGVFLLIGPNIICQYDSGITEAERKENEGFLAEYGSYSYENNFETLLEGSKKYIAEQFYYFVPILSLLILFISGSVLSNSAIMVRRNINKYVIYYCNGLSWKDCIVIQIYGICMLVAAALISCFAIVKIMAVAGIVGNTVIQTGVVEIAACLLLGLFFVAVGMLSVFQQVRGKSAVSIMTEAGHP